MNLIYDLAFYRCHQLPQRSLFWAGLQFPLCMRDTGITIGFLIGLLAIYVAKNYRSRNVDFRTLVLLLPMAVDGFAQFLGFWESTFVSRYVSGLLAGFFVALLVVALLQKEKREKVPSLRTLVWFSVISIPFFIGYFLISLNYSLGIFGAFLFWLIVWSVPFMFLILGLVLAMAAWRYIRKIVEDMEKSLAKSLDRD